MKNDDCIQNLKLLSLDLSKGKEIVSNFSARMKDAERSGNVTEEVHL